MKVFNGFTLLFQLTLVLLISLTTQACLLFTGTLDQSSRPHLRARLIDNGIQICSISTKTNFGPKLKFSCIPGYSAWTDPDVSAIYLEKTDKLFGRYQFSNIARKEWMFWKIGSGEYAEPMTLLEASNYGCRDPEMELQELRGW